GRHCIELQPSSIRSIRLEMGRIRSSFARGSATALAVSVLVVVPAAAAVGARTAPVTVPVTPAAAPVRHAGPGLARAGSVGLAGAEIVARGHRPTGVPAPGGR